MVRTVKSHHEAGEDDEEFVSRTPNSSSQRVKADGKSGDQKANTLRSKHSETEQRRRSKINERFQILRDLIPQNDQKRDKASFLLEVIEYIQYLREQLQTYEGTYQSWSPEPSKLMPWKNNSGPLESFMDQTQLVKNDSGHGNNVVGTSSLLGNENTLESNLNGAAVYKDTDHAPGAATEANQLNMPLQSNLLDGVPPQHSQGSVSEAERLASQSQSQFWQGRPCTTECAVPSYGLNEQEELKVESGEARASNAYSHVLLNNLTQALQSSGVDLSQATISVQLDVAERMIRGLTYPNFHAKEHENLCFGNQNMARRGVGSSSEDSDHTHKRLRTEKH